MVKIENLEQVNELINDIKNNVGITAAVLKKELQDEPLEAFARIKFDRIAFDPLSGEKINFVEMLNQAYSDLVVLRATEELLKKYSNKVFEVNMGAQNGLDTPSLSSAV